MVSSSKYSFGCKRLSHTISHLTSSAIYYTRVALTLKGNYIHKIFSLAWLSSQISKSKESHFSKTYWFGFSVFNIQSIFYEISKMTERIFNIILINNVIEKIFSKARSFEGLHRLFKGELFHYIFCNLKVKKGLSCF